MTIDFSSRQHVSAWTDVVFHHMLVSISGNGGEEQLAIMIAPAQNGRSAIIATQTSCDGGNDKPAVMLHVGCGAGPTTEELQDILLMLLVMWSYHDLPPALRWNLMSNQSVVRMVALIMDHFHMKFDRTRKVPLEPSGVIMRQLMNWASK